MGRYRWTAQRMDQLERAVRNGLRVALTRRGTEYVVTARRLTTVRQRDALVGHIPMTAEEEVFVLDDVDAFQVVD
jgi:uncharacterized protein with PhoU and TrkA domain